ncbi:hypothetical protein ACFUCQ_19755 [Streptomyces sp. NPDC057197]|uniref:hypothetical protein n=1 Tax=Streptomyces sp. NPDC057197 TaxID=3346045 RepID=UPI003626DA00
MPVADHDPLGDEHFGERLTDALRDTGSTFRTDQALLAARGELRGRRLRTRRWAAVAGGVAGVALIGAAGAVVLPGGTGGRQQEAAAATSPAPRSTPATPAGAVTADALVATLKKLLPRGSFSSQEGRGTDTPVAGRTVSPYARVVYDDGRGEAAVAVSVNRLQPGSEEARRTAQCPQLVFVAYENCFFKKLDDGSSLVILKSHEDLNRRSGTKLWSAELVTPRGEHVSVREWNAAAEKGSPVTREQPPLDSAGLKALATAREWRDFAAAVPVDPRASAAPPARDGSVSATLAGLVPRGLKVVSKGTPDPGFGYVVVDDGRGRSLVQVNDQPDMRDVEGQLFGSGAETLPDGTKVVTHRGPGEKGIDGIVMWTVDTIRPDGRRVVVSAFNSGGQKTPATRKEPALTMKQLEGIATDPKWLSLG